MPRRSGFKTLALTLIAAGSFMLAAPALADDATPMLRFQDGHFEPANVVVPANRSFKVVLINADSNAIEFESFELHRERVVRPGETITVLVPPLAPGNYQFFDDFHRGTAKGTIVSK